MNYPPRTSVDTAYPAGPLIQSQFLAQRSYKGKRIPVKVHEVYTVPLPREVFKSPKDIFKVPQTYFSSPKDIIWRPLQVQIFKIIQVVHLLLESSETTVSQTTGGMQTLLKTQIPRANHISVTGYLVPPFW